MKNFDPEFRDLPHYILDITERIWEGRGVGLIRRWYGEDMFLHTSMGPVRGAEAVVRGTLETLGTLPDRRLLGEDVIWSGDEEKGFLSSHRLVCPGHHRGFGPLGPPTGRPVVVRAAADCFCENNQITEEWLVRDYGALARQVGVDPNELGARLAATDMARGVGPWHEADAARLRADGQFRPPEWQDHPAAKLARETWASLWRADLNVVKDAYHHAVSFHSPGHRTTYGHDGVWDVMLPLLAALQDPVLSVEHSIALAEPGHPVRVSTRWWAAATHAGHGPFGAPSGAPVLVLGINHAHVIDGLIREEWCHFDEVAVAKQIAFKRG